MYVSQGCCCSIAKPNSFWFANKIYLNQEQLIIHVAKICAWVSNIAVVLLNIFRQVTCEMFSQTYTSSDLNECKEVPGACTQFCENTPGSYICKCDDGFKKGADGAICKKIDSKLITLVYRSHTMV